MLLLRFRKMLIATVFLLSSIPLKISALENNLQLGFLFATSIYGGRSNNIHFSYPDMEGGVVFDSLTLGFAKTYDLSAQGHNFFELKEGSQIGALLSYTTNYGLIAEIEINKTKRYDIFDSDTGVTNLSKSIASLFSEYANFSSIEHYILSTFINFSYILGDCSSKIRPFLGTGVGLSKINISGKNFVQISPSLFFGETAISSSDATYDYFALGAFESRLNKDNNKLTPIGNIKAGAFFDINDSLSFSLAYKYVGLLKSKEFEPMTAAIMNNKEGTKYIESGVLPSLGLPGERATQVSFFPSHIGKLNVNGYNYKDHSIEIAARHCF